MAGARPDTWMPLFIGDYLADTMHLSHAQHGIYMLLIMAYWRNSGPLPDDAGQLAAIAKCSPQEWRKNLPVIAKFFHIEAGLWSHKRIDVELEGATNKTQERSKAGTEGARRRWQTDGKPMAEPLANGMASPSQNDAPSPSPSPSKLASNLGSRELPREWAALAATERAKAGMPEADLPAEWAKLLAKTDEPTEARWLAWALKARQKPSGNGSTDPSGLPEEPWPQRCRSWAKGHRWMSHWGPDPSEPGCWAPTDLIAEALQLKASRHQPSAAE